MVPEPILEDEDLAALPIIELPARAVLTRVPLLTVVPGGWGLGVLPTATPLSRMAPAADDALHGVAAAGPLLEGGVGAAAPVDGGWLV